MDDAPIPRPKPNGGQLPLCVDLDGTLVKTDTLVEALVGALGNWRALLQLPALLFSGKAGLKRGLARLVPTKPEYLPYDRDVLELLRQEKASGRMLILATAADHRTADAINSHLENLFDDIIASDGIRNLRGSEKARALIERFGEGEFTYAGNDRTDLKVWQAARSGIFVNVSPTVLRRAKQITTVDRVVSRRQNYLGPVIKELRPHQWLKNLLTFVPIITATAVTDIAAGIQSLLTFFSFCAVASSLYILNDLFDLEGDRKHIRKRNRPFASGTVPLISGAILTPSLIVIGAGFAIWAGVLPFIILYAGMSIAYSAKLKELPLFDVFLLAGLYTIRMFAGGVASGYDVTLWLLAFSCFLFLSLAIMKRVTELKLMADTGQNDMDRRGYYIDDIPILIAFGTGATFVSSMVLALYVQTDHVAKLYANPRVLWWIVPLMLFWQCRLWLATQRGQMKDDPIVYAITDWVSACVSVSLLIVMFIAKYVN